MEKKDTQRSIINAAERVFRKRGFRKAYIRDIARDLHMSPANVHRYFPAKSELRAAVCKELLSRIENEGEKIAKRQSGAAQRIGDLLTFVCGTYHNWYIFDRNLYELIQAAITENWTVVSEHEQRMATILAQIIADGTATGEFRPCEPALAACIVNFACMRFWHPSLMGDLDQKPEAALAQMIDFCISALS